jgi:hypothetical protein
MTKGNGIATKITSHWVALSVIGGAVIFGISINRFYRMPRVNAARIAAHDTLPAHPWAQGEIVQMKFLQQQQLCLHASERDSTVHWEECLVPGQLESFRRGNR